MSPLYILLVNHSLGGKNGWCGVCLKDAKTGNPESNCPYAAHAYPETIVRPNKNWGFCSDLCNIYDKFGSILQETKLDLISLKDCGILLHKGLGFNQKVEVCAGKKNKYPQMRVYALKKRRGGKIYFKQYRNKTNYVKTQLLFSMPLLVWLSFAELRGE